MNFDPEFEKKGNGLAAPADTQAMLDRRYDEIKSGKVKLIPGDEVFARLREKSAARK